MDSETDDVRELRLRRLVEDHFDFVWRLLRRLGATSADADDRAQQVFMIATRKLDDIDPGSERTFLYGTALRVAANARRSSQRRREQTADLDAAPSERSGPEDLTELSRAMTLLDRVLERLSPELRRVLVLAEIEQLEVSEIAKLESLKRGTAASRLRRARQAFQRALAELGVEHPFREGTS